MKTVRFKLLDSLHKSAREFAARENILVNQFVILALAEKSPFWAAMATVAQVEPPDDDRL